MIEKGRGDGYMDVTREYEEYNYRTFGEQPRRHVHDIHMTVQIEMQVDPEFLVWAQEIAMEPAVRAPPPRDYKAALELLIEIVKVIVRAWAADDNRIRFGLLELD